MRRIAVIGLGAASLALAACGQQGSDGAQGGAATQLADRIAIEDLIVSYYAHLGGRDAAGIPEFFTEDAVLDVNGIIMTGHEEILSLYDRGDAEPSTEPAEGDGGEQPTFHMLLSNPVIEVTGDTAKASFIWTGVMNSAIAEPPELAEQGREYDTLVKRDGKWLITHRVIIADSGLPDMYLETYTPRKDFRLDDLE